MDKITSGAGLLGDVSSKSAFTMISDRFYQRYHYESRFRVWRLQAERKIGRLICGKPVDEVNLGGQFISQQAVGE